MPPGRIIHSITYGNQGHDKPILFLPNSFLDTKNH